jgi:hypothetical protein
MIKMRWLVESARPATLEEILECEDKDEADILLKFGKPETRKLQYSDGISTESFSLNWIDVPEVIQE